MWCAARTLPDSHVLWRRGLVRARRCWHRCLCCAGAFSPLDPARWCDTAEVIRTQPGRPQQRAHAKNHAARCRASRGANIAVHAEHGRPAAQPVGKMRKQNDRWRPRTLAALHNDLLRNDNQAHAERIVATLPRLTLGIRSTRNLEGCFGLYQSLY